MDIKKITFDQVVRLCHICDSEFDQSSFETHIKKCQQEKKFMKLANKKISEDEIDDIMNNCEIIKTVKNVEQNTKQNVKQNNNQKVKQNVEKNVDNKNPEESLNQNPGTSAVQGGLKSTIIYNCDYAQCNETFDDPIKLKKHIECDHFGISHKCHYCPKSYDSVKSLKYHIKAKHEGVNNYQCKDCNKGFAYRYAYNKHIKTVHSGIVHECNLCKRTYKDLHNLKKHKAKCHVNKDEDDIDDIMKYCEIIKT